MQKSEIWLRALGQKNQGMNSVDMHVPTVNESDSTELSPVYFFFGTCMFNGFLRDDANRVFQPL